MATFKETREVLLASYACGIITDEEFSLLFEENSSSNFHLRQLPAVQFGEPK